MKYALVNGIKSEPFPKLRGVCAHCDSDMVSKCGAHKIWHWAHKRRDICDPWWEGETKWHREWKGMFSADWQEIGHIDELTGEKHIADVINPFGLIIEFQHSPISIGERTSRENFYNQMVWVVDGTRGLDKGYFTLGLRGPIQDDPLAYQIDWLSSSRILHNWEGASAKVYLDFGDDTLWRLITFDPKKKRGAVGPIPKSVFVNDCMSGTEISITIIPEGADREDFRRPKLEKYPKIS